MPAADQRPHRNARSRAGARREAARSISIASEWELYEATQARLEPRARRTERSSPPPEIGPRAGEVRRPSRADAHHASAAIRTCRATSSSHTSRSCSATQTPAIPPAADGARSAGRRTRARRLDRLARQPAHRPRDRQPRLAASLRPRHRPLGQQLRRARRRRRRIPSCSTGSPLWLIDHDWQLKPLHRLIMTSNAYQMSSPGRRTRRSPSIRRTTCSGGSTCGGSAPRKSATRCSPPRGELNPDDVRPELLSRDLAPKCSPRSRSPATAGASRRRGRAAPPQRLHPREALAAAAAAHARSTSPTSTPAAKPASPPRSRPRRCRCSTASSPTSSAAKLAERVIARSRRDDPRDQVARAFDLALGRQPTDERNRRRPRPARNSCRQEHDRDPDDALALLVPRGAEPERVRVPRLDPRSDSRCGIFDASRKRRGAKTHEPSREPITPQLLRPHAPRVPLGNRLRLRRGGAHVAARRRRLLQLASRRRRRRVDLRQPARPQAGPASPPRPRASSSCSCTAARATSTRSTTSPSMVGMDGKTIDRQDLRPRRPQERRPHRRAAVEVQAVRPVRQVGQRPLPAPRRAASTTSPSSTR